MNRFLTYVSALFVIGAFWTSHAHGLPSFEEVRAGYVPSESLLLDRHGDILHELRTDNKRRRLAWTPLAEISPSLTTAVLASEDARFYKHGGVDYLALGAAASSWLPGGKKRGASTITMQLASLLNKNLQNKSKRRTLTQKTGQMRAAYDLEKSWSKNQILEAYVNLVTFRGEHQGIAAAARGFFGKDPHGLDQTQSLILASLIRAPNATAETLNKRATLLNQTLNWAVPPDALLADVHALCLDTNQVRQRATGAPHVARQLFRNKTGRSMITCTLDSPLQTFAQELLSQQVSALQGQNVQEGSVLVLDNASGDILVYVSYSNRPDIAGYVDGVRAKRQAGSTLKPFLYAAALDEKILTAQSILDDSPVDVALPGGIYQPDNYNSSFYGPTPVRVALASSLNVPAVKVLTLVGTESFLRRLRELGVKGLPESGDFYGLSLALGSADVTLWELTNAYRTLANSGIINDVHLTRSEPQNPSAGRKVFSAGASFIISDILSDRVARSATFGLENPLATRFWTAVKTGTSKDMRDNWCVGFSSRYTVGVWVGNFSGEPMWNVSGITGAAPIWITLINELHRNRPSHPPGPPAGVRKVKYRPDTETEREEWFISGTEPHHPAAGIARQNQRIIYPPSGAILALDPDIPPSLQKIFFTAQNHDDGSTGWILNDTFLAARGKTVSWTPKAGKYVLAIVNHDHKIVDTVTFEVRGSSDKHQGGK
jgi:penicillin-binding protein 1C